MEIELFECKADYYCYMSVFNLHLKNLTAIPKQWQQLNSVALELVLSYALIVCFAPEIKDKLGLYTINEI